MPKSRVPDFIGAGYSKPQGVESEAEGRVLADKPSGYALGFHATLLMTRRVISVKIASEARSDTSE